MKIYSHKNNLFFNGFIHKLKEVLKRSEQRFLDLSVNDNTRQKIDAAQIKAEFPDNTFSYQLLMKLLESPEPELKVQQAYELIKKMKA